MIDGNRSIIALSALRFARQRVSSPQRAKGPHRPRRGDDTPMHLCAHDTRRSCHAAFAAALPERQATAKPLSMDRTPRDS